jgi:hypothetical protein
MPGWPGRFSAAGRSSSTEAASRGVAGGVRPLRTSRACSASAEGRRKIAWSGGAGLAGPVLADPVLAGPVLAGPVLADPVLAGSGTRGVRDLGDQLDFDGSVEREDGHPDRAAGVPPRFTEHL